MTLPIKACNARGVFQVNISLISPIDTKDIPPNTPIVQCENPLYNNSITFYEFIFGVILNIWLGLNIWDYSNLPFNILGQICIPFSTIWYFLSIIGICLDDFFRWKLFNEEKPRYKIF